MDELDRKPTIEEHNKIIIKIPSWKAPYSDGIPADMLRLSHCIRTRLPDQIAITTGKFP